MKNIRNKLAILTLVLSALLCMPGFSGADFPDDMIIAKQRFSLSTQETQFIKNLGPLTVMVDDNFAPLSKYNAKTSSYEGISVALLSHLANKLGLKYKFQHDKKLTWSDKIELIKKRQIDLLMPASFTPERAANGIFTTSFYKTYYCVIAKKTRGITISDSSELASYKVGVGKASSIISYLQPLIPASQIVVYDTTAALYQGLKKGDVDVVLRNKHVYFQDRFNLELFDLDILHTISESPRHYSYYLSNTEQNKQLVTIIDRYLAGIDTSRMVEYYDQGEDAVILRYSEQRYERNILIVAVTGLVLLVALAGVALFKSLRRKEQLLANRLLLNATLESMAEGFLVVDNNGHVSLWNQNFIDLWHIPKELLDTHSDTRLLDYAASQMSKPSEFLDIIKTLYENPEKTSDDELHLSDGRVLRRTSQPHKIGTDVLGRVWSFEDITERKRLENKLKELSRAVEQSPVSIVITDVMGTIEFVNPSFTTLTGYTSAEAIGQNPRILKSDQTPKETFTELWSTISSGKTWVGEFVNKSKDGSLFWEQATISALRSDSGAITSYLAVKENITEKKNITEQLIAAKERAEDATRAKSDFLSTMSHELRTPMNGVVGMAGILLDMELGKEQREYAEMIRTSGDNLLSLISGILDFSKIEARMLDLELSYFDVRKTVKDTADMLTIQANKAGLALTCRIDPDVPAELRGDEGRIRQVITNLVGNAIKFTREGELVVSVKLHAEHSDYVDILFEVSDNGIGIPEARCAAIFEPFTQADSSTTRNYGGSGLGLAICKQLAELMGGAIGVTSVEGRGSTFWFTARLEKHVSRDIQSDSHDEIQQKVTLSVDHGICVLLAEDNIINQRVAVKILTQLGCTVDVASNGHEAVRALELKNYDLVLMDCQMPQMDGYEATTEIRNKHSNVINHDVTIIAMTANATTGDREKCLAAGMNDYLTKPVKKNNLLEVIARWVVSTTH